MPRVTLIDVGRPIAEAVSVAVRGEYGVADVDVIPQALALLAGGADPIDAVLVGPSVPGPILLALRLQAAQPHLSVLLLASDEDVEPMRRALAAAPLLSSDVKVIHAGEGPEALAGALKAAAARGTRRRNRRLEDEAEPRPETGAGPASSAGIYLSLLLEHTPAGVAVVDVQGRIGAANERALDLLGVGARRSLGEPLPAMFPDSARVRELIARAFREPVPAIDRLERRAGGDPKVLELTVVAVTGHRAEPTALVLLRDTTETVHAIRDARDARSRLEFLADAGMALASSLDYEATLSAVARLAVPAVADWCAVDIADDDGTLHRLAVAHADPEKEALVRDLGERYPPDPNSRYGPYEVLRTGRPQLMPEVTREILEAAARDEHHLAMLESLAIRSAMVIPIPGAGRPLGSIVFASAASGRVFDDTDVALAEELARRAGIAIDNARLFESLTEAERRYRDLVGDINAIVWEWDVARNEPLFISRHVEEMLGLPAQELMAEPSLAWENIHPEDQERMREQRREAVRTGADYEAQYRMFDANGRVVWLRDVVRCVRNDQGQVAALRGVTVDISHIRRERNREAVDHEISRVLADASTLEEAVPQILRAVCRILDWDIGVFWRVEPHDESLRVIDVAGSEEGDPSPLLDRDRASAFSQGEGLAQAVWRHAEPVWVEDLPEGARAESAADAPGLQSGFGFPIETGGGVAGVIAFFDRRRRRRDERLLSMLGPVGGRIGQLIVQSAAVEALRASDSRVRAMLDTAHDAVITIDHAGRVIEFNASAERIFGYERGSAIGRPLADLIVPPELVEAHRAGVERAARGGESTILDRRLRMPAVRADGTRLTVELTISRVGTLEPPAFTAYARDITESIAAERRRDVEHAVARVLAEESDVDAALRQIVAIIGSTLGWTAGSAWRPDGESGLHCVHVWTDGDQASAFAAATQDASLRGGEGLPGRVYDSQEAVWIADTAADENFPRRHAAVADGLRSGFGFPISHGGAVLGVLELFTSTPSERDENLLTMMTAVGSQLGQFIRRREAEEQLHLQNVLLESQAEATIDGILVVAPDRTILFHNARFAAMWGLSDEILASRSREAALEAVLAKVADPEGFSRRADELMADPLAVGRDEIRLADGRVFDRYSTPLRDSAGRPRGRAMYFRDVTAEKRVERVLRENEERFAFLADVSSLLVSSLDEHVVLDRLVRRAVPALGDWAAVDLVQPGGGYRRVALAHVDPQKAREAEASDVLSVYEHAAGDGGVPQVLRTGRPVLAPVASDAPLDAGAPVGRRRAVEALGLGSYVSVPLVARGRIIGAFTLAAGPEGRRYGPADLSLAEEVTRRAALAVDNARLFHERAHVAKTLQQSMLPPELPEIAGLEVGGRYHAAGEGTEVGGDFYDLFRTAGRNWAFVMGDVCGKGADAAAVTALARYTIRAAAMRMRKPSNILRTLNEALLQQGDETKFCTVAFARVSIRGAAARATISCGGHPLPLVLRASGEVEAAGGGGSLLGVLDQPSLTEESVELYPGDALVLYTDGVTEARGPAGVFGEDGFAALVASCKGLDAAAIAATIEERVMEFQEGQARDDIAVLTLRVPPVKGA